MAQKLVKATLVGGLGVGGRSIWMVSIEASNPCRGFVFVHNFAQPTEDSGKSQKRHLEIWELTMGLVGVEGLRRRFGDFFFCDFCWIVASFVAGLLDGMFE